MRSAGREARNSGCENVDLLFLQGKLLFWRDARIGSAGISGPLVTGVASQLGAVVAVNKIECAGIWHTHTPAGLPPRNVYCARVTVYTKRPGVASSRASGAVGGRSVAKQPAPNVCRLVVRRSSWQAHSALWQVWRWEPRDRPRHA